MDNERLEFSVRVDSPVKDSLPLPIFDLEGSLIGAFTVYHENLLKGFIAAVGWPDSLFAQDGLWFTLSKNSDHAIVSSQGVHGQKSFKINTIERGIL